MKRSRNEQIMTGVNHYLKLRQYADTDSVADKKTVCDIKELLMSSAVRNNDSSNGTINYSSISGDAAAFDQQYSRTKTWMSEAVEPYRAELQSLLCPFFTHVYLELLCNGQKGAAVKFFSRHQSSLSDSEEHKTLITALAGLTSKEDLIHNKLITEFREKRYHVSLSEGSFQYLTRYIQHEDNILILQIVNHHLDITVRSDELSVRETVPEHNVEWGSIPARPLSVSHTTGGAVGVGGGGAEVKANDAALNALHRAIQRVEAGVPTLPSICLYALQNNSQGSKGCTSACISSDDTYMSAGFEDSRLMLWPIVPIPLSRSQPALKVTPVDVSVSQFHLAGDHPDDVRLKLSGKSIYPSTSNTSSQSVHSEEEGSCLLAHSGTICASSFMHDHTYLLSASHDKTVRLWDVATRTNVVCYRGHNYPVLNLDTSDTGSMFASCSLDQTAKLWCTDRVHPLRTFIGHTAGVHCVKFHPNGNYIATGSSDMTVRLWSIQDGQPVRLFHGHRGRVMNVAFSPNGKYLASAGEDMKVKVWDLGTGTLFKDLRGHSDIIYSLVFNAQSTLLASGGLDANINLWDIRRNASTAETSPASVVVNSPELLASYKTKAHAILCLKYSKRNFLQVFAS